jgi:esterase/lipase superfamily enzyme
MPVDAPPERGYHVVEVFYATDRKPTGSSKAAHRYGPARGDGSLAYGICEVSIPEDHRVGRLEGPSWRRFELRPDPEKHVILLDLKELSGGRFFTDLSATLRGSPQNQILLFLHGFNVSFEDAARRTAQMAYDLKFEGAPAFYSWPSKGALAAYTHDEATVEWTVPHLKAFLQDLAERSGAEAIHLIAHSMGNRALTRALEQLAAVMADPAAPSFTEVILTAPDIDADVFRQVAAAFRRAARRVTLYASERDRALLASHKVHGYPRAGDGGRNIVVVPGIDTIDASALETDFLGHSFFGSNDSVISDLFYVLRGHAPKGRSRLRPRESPAGRYWAFVP